MPYAILVAALGAIVSTAIAMFAMHSWSATKLAPFIGAILGMVVGLAMLRLRGLPLGATREQYRSAGRDESVTEVFRRYLNIALGTATAVSMVELPVFLFTDAAAPYVFVAGIAVIAAYTVYRARRSNDQRLFNVNLDVFNIAGAAGGLLISGFILYGASRGWLNLVLKASGAELVKGILVCNAFAALNATVIAVYGLNLGNRLLKMMSPQRH